jgi:site-specific DNA recombinase
MLPYGYAYVPEAHKGSVVINDEEAAVVRRVFAMYCAGKSLHAIAVALTQDKIIPKRATGPCKWRESSLHAMLSNDTYATGILFWNKRRYSDHRVTETRDRSEWFEIPVSPILSQEVFNAARQQSERNARFARRNRKYDYLFIGGMLRCGRCGASMSGYAPGGRVPRYRCASLFTHHPGEPFCGGAIRVDHIEPLVWQEVERVLNDPARVLAELERLEHAHGAMTVDMKKEHQSVRKALAALEREAQRWDEAYAHEVIELTELKAKKMDLAERKQRLLAQQEAVEASMLAADLDQAQAREALLYCQRLDAPHKRRALEALAVRVTWSPGEPIRLEGCILLGNIVYNALRRTGSSPNTAPGICVG